MRNKFFIVDGSGFQNNKLSKKVFFIFRNTMSWFFSSKPEPKNRLPNGDIAPVVCPNCLAEQSTCQCSTTAIEAVTAACSSSVSKTTSQLTPLTSSTIYTAPNPIQMSAPNNAAAGAASNQHTTQLAAAATAVVDGTKKKPKEIPKKSTTPTATAADIRCLQCGNEHEKCVCPEVVEPRETGIRQRTPIPERIKKMLEFSEELHGLLNLGFKSEDHHNGLMQRGEDLAKQHDCFAKNMQRGVITGDMMKTHLGEVDRWLKECDAYHAKLCEHSAWLLEQLPESVTSAITSTSSTSTTSSTSDAAISTMSVLKEY